MKNHLGKYLLLLKKVNIFAYYGHSIGPRSLKKYVGRDKKSLMESFPGANPIKLFSIVTKTFPISESTTKKVFLGLAPVCCKSNLLSNFKK